MKDGWCAFYSTIAFIIGFIASIYLFADVYRKDRTFADCVLEQRGTAQECAVLSGKWANERPERVKGGK